METETQENKSNGTPDGNKPDGILNEPQVIYTDETGKGWTAEELKSGIMMQSDYTRKTQELAEERKQNELRIKQAEFVENVLPELLEYDPIVVDRMIGRIDKLPPKELHFESEDAKTVYELKQKIDKIEKQIQLQTVQARLEQGFAEVKKIDPSVDESALRKYMVDYNTNHPESPIFDPLIAYRSMSYDVLPNKIKKQYEAEYIAKKQQAETEALVGEKNTNTNRTIDVPPRTATTEERMQYALSKVNI